MRSDAGGEVFEGQGIWINPGGEKIVNCRLKRLRQRAQQGVRLIEEIRASWTHPGRLSTCHEQRIW